MGTHTRTLNNYIIETANTFLHKHTNSDKCTRTQKNRIKNAH